MFDKRIIALLAAIPVLIAIIVAAIAAALFALLSFLTTVAQEAYLNSCVNDQVVTGPAHTGRKFLSKEQMAATIYSQAIGLGLGETGALIGIATAIGEGNLGNGGVGDTIGSNYRQFKIGNKYASPGMMTDSRGPFQQRASYVPKELAWSGLNFTYEDSRRVFSDRDPITGEKDAWNPWRTTGWARSDPRMNQAQAANIFFIGGASGQIGLEDVFTRSRAVRNNTSPVPPPGAFTDTELGTFAQTVQRSATPNKYATKMEEARGYLNQIKEGTISVPPFVQPANFLINRVSSNRVSNALGVAGRNPSTVTEPEIPSVNGDGVTLIGDSVMKHTVKAAKVPDELFGGPVKHHSMVGISLAGVLSGRDIRASDGSRDPQGRRLTPTSEWIRSITEGPSRIIVQLGTNGGGTREQVDTFMNLASPNRDVYWFSQHYGPSAEFNNVLLEAAARHPNLTVVDISNVPGINVTSRRYHPWSGLPARSDPTIEMWKRMMDAVATGGEPNIIKSIACGGLGMFVGDIQAPTQEAANAVLWAINKERQGTAYIAGANPGNPDGRAFDCSTFTHSAWVAGGFSWPMQTSSRQWADTKNIQLIPISAAQPGDLIWSNWGGGDTASGGVAGHVAIIVGFEDGVPIAVGAENPSSGVRKYALNAYRPTRGFLGLKDPNAPRGSATDASNVQYSQNWEDAWVGRMVGGTPMPGASTPQTASTI